MCRTKTKDDVTVEVTVAVQQQPARVSGANYFDQQRKPLGPGCASALTLSFTPDMRAR